MDIAAIGFSTLLVGIPAFAGAFLVINYFGQPRTSSGASLLVFAIAVCLVFVIYAPEGRVRPGDYGLSAPGALVLGALLGAAAGFISRHRRKSS